MRKEELEMKKRHLEADTIRQDEMLDFSNVRKYIDIKFNSGKNNTKQLLENIKQETVPY